MECPKCEFENPDDFKFCGKCAHPLEEKAETSSIGITTESERKHVTIMFSDLSGYTAMTERLDPEEVKEIMSQIFGEITQIIHKYEGFIERFIGDAVMAIFGIPKAHEDDPVRAIRAAMEIHAAVESFSPQFEERIGHSLTMHTGINTGLVITGEIDVEKGIHGLTGDAINLASRLEGIAQAGEIVVGPDTYHQATNWFEFEALEPTQVKGKADPVSVYKVVSVLDQHAATQRLHNVQAKLIGRETEMALLMEAVGNLKQRKGSIISIVGHAGTGKSRLIQEFRAKLEPDEVQWREGHAYAYTQNMAYYPLTNLLTHAFQIREGDNPDQIREKVEIGVKALLWDKPEAKQYLGSLFSLRYAEIDEVSPEFWRSQLHESVQQILEAVACRGPTVVLFEDLHWADDSFIELLHLLLQNTRRPVLFLCVYRPSFKLFPEGKPDSLAWPHQKIDLKELSWDETGAMLQSLLNAAHLPDELRYFIKQKVEGNPFYLEEVINTLIDTGTLVSKDGTWRLTKSLDLADIPTTIQGMLTARLDRLEKQAKRILQEASVIGRAFFHKVLTRITELSTPVDGYLSGLERLDLIRARTKEPDLEYIFKHALTQEVVYNGLLKKERRKIHERIALVMEEIFADRLPEFYETLAFHFSRGQSVQRAVNYLIKSGEKSLGRYAVKEAHQYFEESFTILTAKPELTKDDHDLLIELLIKWAYVFYYRGDFKGLVELFSLHEQIAKSLRNKTKQGFFLAWLGMALWMRENLRESEQYLREALELGQATGDQKLIGYACCWLSITCSDLGLFDEALELAEKGYEIAELLDSDHYLYFKSLHAKGFAYHYMGYCKENLQIGKALLNYGNEHANSRCLVLGHMSMSFAHSVAGNPVLALDASKEAVRVSADPIYSIIPNAIGAYSYFQMGEFEEAEKIAMATMAFHEKFGCEFHGTAASLIIGGVMIAKGKMALGLKQIEEILLRLEQIEKKSFVPTVEYILGKIYFQIATGEGSLSLASLLRNAVFLARTLPVASKRAEYHFKKAIDMAKEIGAKGVIGQAYLDLGLLYKTKKRKNQAKQYISKAIHLFKETKAEVFLKLAKKAMESLG